jgi:hypothetical protein
VSEGPRYERLLPFACLAGATLLIASELMDTFSFDAVDEVSGTVGAVATVADRHQYAMLVLGLFAILALFVAIGSGSKPAAVAVAVSGAVALLLFVLIDVPDAGKVGTFSDAGRSFVDAKAVPQGGFWLELIGALVLAVCGGALATLSPAQLRALRPGNRGRGRVKDGEPARAKRGRSTVPERRSAVDGAAVDGTGAAAIRATAGADGKKDPRRKRGRRLGKASGKSGRS